MGRRAPIPDEIRRERLADVSAEAVYLDRMQRQAEEARRGLNKAMARADRTGVAHPEIARASGLSVSSVKRGIAKARKGL